MRSASALLFAIAFALVYAVSHASAEIDPYYIPDITGFCDECGGNSTIPQACIQTSNRLVGRGVYTCRSCANATNDDHYAQCESTLTRRSTTPCVSLKTSTEHCGACNNRCETGETCVDGSCQCSHSSCAAKNQVCNQETLKCEAICPAGKGHCFVSGTETGTADDCQTDFTDVFTCGSCTNNCKSNGMADTCSDGVCKCGTNPRCSGATPFCHEGACVACIPGDTDAACNLGSNAVTPYGYCDAETNKCKSCPIGKASCGLAPSQESDCDTQIDESGQVLNCGACGASTVTPNKAFTCCKGTPKCGSFADRDAPTDSECEAASACGTGSYCDEGLQRCLPFISFYEGSLQNCLANSYHESSGPSGVVLNSAQPSKCGSCNKTVSDSNIVTTIDNSTGLISKICLMSNENNCGAVGNKCAGATVCQDGRCVCTTWSQNWFSYNPYRELDPELKGFKFTDFPAEGCNLHAPQQTRFDLFSARSTGYLSSFMDCAEAANLSTVVTPNDFNDPDARAAICNNALGKCNATFCDNLYNKMSTLKANGMCEAFTSYGDWFANCAMNYRPNAILAADPTCRDRAIDYLGDVGSSGYSSGIAYGVQWQEVAYFVGCPEAKKHEAAGYAIPIPYNLGPIALLHKEITKTYLGSASSAALSFASAVVAMIACAFIA